MIPAVEAKAGRHAANASHGAAISPGFSHNRWPQKDTCGAVVVGGAHGSLGVVRSLGRRKIPVCLLSHDQRILKLSRYASFSPAWRGPEPADAPQRLLDLARRHHMEGWVLLPGGDAEAEMISRHHAELSSTFRVTTPPWDVIRWALDKRLTYDRASQLGIDHPWSYYPKSREDIASLECRFPVILKPTVRRETNAFTQAKAWRADDRETLLARYDQAVRLVGEEAIVLQEFIPGNGMTQFSYAAVWDGSGPVASLVARRTRQYPIDFGYTSTFVESIDEPVLEDLACRFLRSIGYQGVVEVEFKHDARDGCYKILDVNARTWAWQSLGRAVGVDFPHIMWRLALGEPVPRLRGRPGAAWIHWSRDFVAACQEMWAGTLSPGCYLRSLHGPMEFAAMAKDDLVPGLLDTPLLLRKLWKRPR